MAFDMKSVLGFEKLITPVIIKIVYYIGIVAVVLFGLFTIIQGIRFNMASSMFGGLFIIVLGPILVRFYCELLIVIFNIHDYLRDMRDQGRR